MSLLNSNTDSHSERTRTVLAVDAAPFAVVSLLLLLRSAKKRRRPVGAFPVSPPLAFKTRSGQHRRNVFQMQNHSDTRRFRLSRWATDADWFWKFSRFCVPLGMGKHSRILIHNAVNSRVRTEVSAVPWIVFSLGVQTAMEKLATYSDMRLNLKYDIHEK